MIDKKKHLVVASDSVYYKEQQISYQNYLMSNIRDLQKLKGSRKMQEILQMNMRFINPDITNFICDSNSTNISLQQKNNKNSQPAKESFKLMPYKSTHQRGTSFGTPELTQRFTSKLIQNPKLSVYNMPFKRQFVQILKDNQHIQYPQIPKTERKVKNNYVVCNDSNTTKRGSSFGLRNDVQKKIGKNSFNLLFPIGKGGFGKVWKVEAKRNKKIYAMKEMIKAKVISKKSVASVINQKTFLQKLNHSYIVNMSYAFQDRQNLYLVMDYLDGGDLRYHLGNKQFFNQKQTKFFISNIILALQYLHRHKIIHRDLKPQNLVFDCQGFLKLTDLGISRELRQDNHQDTSGTPGYMAPQVMVRRSHSFTADYYALGVIAYELMLARRPYVGANRKQIKDQILSRQASVKLDQLPFKWSPHCLDFINRLLLRNPDQRLGSNGMDEIKNHPWLSDVDWQKLLNRNVNPPFKPMSIQQDYQNYKEQISEDTVIQNEQQILLLLRKSEAKQLFQNYHFQKSQNELLSKKSTSYPTNSTEENHGRK